MLASASLLAFAAGEAADADGEDPSTGALGLIIIWAKGSTLAEQITKSIRRQKAKVSTRGLYYFSIPSRAATPLQRLATHTKSCGMGKSVVLLIQGHHLGDLQPEFREKKCVTLLLDAHHIKTVTGLEEEDFGQAVAALPEFSGAISQLDSDEVTRFGSHLLLEGTKQMMKDGLFSAALPVLHKVAALEPRHGALHSSIGIALASVGDRPGALVSLKHAVALTPNDPNLRSRLAMMLEEEHLLEEAAAEYGQAVMLEPKDALHLASLGHVQRKLGLAADSETNFNT